jgi:microcystin-dependent protein
VRSPPRVVADLPAYLTLEGLIIMWAGPLAEIPPGWDLCDGTDGTPDLSDRFVLGVLPGQQPGEVGGANVFELTEGHLPAHTHELSIDEVGPHVHRFHDLACDAVEFWFLGGLWTLQGIPADPDPDQTDVWTVHKHDGRALSPGYGGSFDNRPAYARLAFLRRNGAVPGRSLPMGAILLWRDTLQAIPRGYQLCDGLEGTPDLTDRFVMGVFPGEDPGSTGGAASIALAEWDVPAHEHVYRTEEGGAHQHGLGDRSCTLETLNTGGLVVLHLVGDSDEGWAQTDPDLYDHEHTGRAADAGASQAFDNRPGHVRMAYVVQTASVRALPDRVIALWAGSLSEVPKGWRPCDGTAGTPDLRDLFVAGTLPGQDPGDLDGAHQRTLSVEQMPVHGHDLSESEWPGPSEHVHTLVDDHGVDVTVGTGGLIPGVRSYGNPIGNGNETHEDGAHTHSGVTDAAGGSQPFDNRPAFYRVAFIMKD